MHTFGTVAASAQVHQMALKYRGFSASIENMEETIQMYDIDEDDDVISCWIESKVGEVSASDVEHGLIILGEV